MILFFSIYIDMDVDVGIDIDYPEGSRLAFLFLGKLEQFSLTIYTLKGVFSQLIALTAFQPLSAVNHRAQIDWRLAPQTSSENGNSFFTQVLVSVSLRFLLLLILLQGLSCCFICFFPSRISDPSRFLQYLVYIYWTLIWVLFGSYFSRTSRIWWAERWLLSWRTT